jgi:hypothetical protein
MSPHPIFTGWQLNRQAAWSAISRYIYLLQFSQACHNYNVFDNRDVCVCVYFAWSSSNSQSYLAVWVVSTYWSLAGCVYEGPHIAHLPLSVNCLLVSTHSYCKKKKWKKCLVCKCCVLETVGYSELWSKPGKLRQKFFFDSSSCVVWTKMICQLKGRVWLDVRVDVFSRCTKNSS